MLEFLANTSYYAGIMLDVSGTHYAPNYAGIIVWSLLTVILLLNNKEHHNDCLLALINLTLLLHNT